MAKTFEYFLAQVKSQNKINESIHWMSGPIPSPSEWEKVQLSTIQGHETYRFKLLDNWYVIPESKIEWFKENVGKDIKFKYDKETRDIFQAELVEKQQITNEAIGSADLKNILTKYTQFLHNEGIAVGVPKDEHLDILINRFLGL